MAAFRYFFSQKTLINGIVNKSKHNIYSITTLIRPKTDDASKQSKPSSTSFTSIEGLREFFDDEANWGITEMKCGRAWNAEDLRIKSNTDLHKLWYILLKERNMLFTMEAECKRLGRLFPSAERIDKVEISMENVETVVRERNKAYHLLEMGLTGERRVQEVMGPFGLPIEHTQEEHFIPKHQNEEWLQKHTHDVDGKDVRHFLKYYREQELMKNRRKKNRDFNHVIGLLKRFPDMDMEALKEQYPDVDIEKAKQSRKCRGHFVPK